MRSNDVVALGYDVLIVDGEKIKGPFRVNGSHETLNQHGHKRVHFTLDGHGDRQFKRGELFRSLYGCEHAIRDYKRNERKQLELKIT